MRPSFRLVIFAGLLTVPWIVLGVIAAVRAEWGPFLGWLIGAVSSLGATIGLLVLDTRIKAKTPDTESP